MDFNLDGFVKKVCELHRRIKEQNINLSAISATRLLRAAFEETNELSDPMGGPPTERISIHQEYDKVSTDEVLLGLYREYRDFKIGTYSNMDIRTYCDLDIVEREHIRFLAKRAIMEEIVQQNIATAPTDDQYKK